MNQLRDHYSPHALDQIYDEGYFHGIGSGYRREGYEHDHADWTPWLRMTAEAFQRAITWLDIGCAYGYLVEQAHPLPVQAFGVDISSYALRCNPNVRGALSQALSETLPFADGVFDAVSLFDVIEHVPDPSRVLDEAARVLKPNGVLWITTPDPMVFSREEPTHIHERPPAYWVAQLQARGFAVNLRFGPEPYEIQLLAYRGDWDFFEPLQKAFQNQSTVANPNCHRSGEFFYHVSRIWRQEDAVQDGDHLYCLNHHTQPIQIQLTIQTGTEPHPDVFLNDLKLTYRSGTPKDGTWLHSWEPVTLPPGGQTLGFFVESDVIPINKIFFQAEKRDSQAYLNELPFDHYQRYHLVKQIIESYGEPSLRILDVGGALGRLQVFVPQHEVTVLDRVWEDTPQSMIYENDNFPFADQAFDFVVSIDTLEHIAQEKRLAFLGELKRTARRAVILCGPYDDPFVAEAEHTVQNFIAQQLKRRDRFLDEHEQYTLPNRAEVKSFFEELHFQVHELPNGYLPRWLGMQLAANALSLAPEQHYARARINALYNTLYAPRDNQEPAYRRVMVAAAEPVSVNLVHNWLALAAPPESATALPAWSLAPLIAALSNTGLLQDKDRLLENQQNNLQQLIAHLGNLQKQIHQEHEQRENFFQHSANLEKALKHEQKNASNQHKHVENMEARFKELTQHSANLDKALEEQTQHSANLDKALEEQTQHSANLDKALEEQTQHSANLAKALEEQTRHAKNLEQRLAEQQLQINRLLDHINNVENQETQWKTHAENLQSHNQTLQSHNQGLQKHTHNLEQLLREKESQIQWLNEQYHQIDKHWHDLLVMLRVSTSLSNEVAVAAIHQKFDTLHQQLERAYSSPVYRALAKINLLPKRTDRAEL